MNLVTARRMMQGFGKAKSLNACRFFCKNLFFENIFARCYCFFPIYKVQGRLSPFATNYGARKVAPFRQRISICAKALLQKSETARAELLRQRAVRKTERRAALRRTLGFSKKSSDCFRQFEKNRTRKGINNAARKVAPFRSGTQFVACDLSR